MFYRFPMSRVSIAAIPKTGSTSVLDFLLRLETFLEAGHSQSDPDILLCNPKLIEGQRSDDDNLGAGSTLKSYAVSANSSIVAGELRLATVRDPADRVASCWLDKFVDAPSAWQAKYYTKQWFPQDFRTPRAIEASFLQFLRALRDDPKLLHSDSHWAPQHWMLRPWQASCLVEIDYVNDLPAIIYGRINNLAGVQVASMPHMHKTDAWLKQFLLTAKTQTLISEIYSLDYDMLEKCSKNRPINRRAVRLESSCQDAWKLPAFDRQVHLQRNHRLSQSLSKVLNRAVWGRLLNSQK